MYSKNIVVEAFNSILPLVRELELEGYKVTTSHNSSTGFGFHLPLDSKHYIHLIIFNIGVAEYSISLRRRNSRLSFDSINDIELKHEMKYTSADVSDYIRSLLTYWEKNIKDVSPREAIKRDVSALSRISEKDVDAFMTALDNVHDVLQSKLTDELAAQVIEYLKS